MNNGDITLEICSNTEWLTVFGPVESTDFSNEACQFFLSKLHGSLIDLGYETKSPRGQRILCHGWNSAQFNHSLGAVGTFDPLTNEQQNEIIEAVTAAAEETNKKLADAGEPVAE